MAVELVDTPEGQIKVETGKGVVKDIDPVDGQRNVKVTIDADHLKLPVTSWLDTQHTLLRDNAFGAWQTGEKVTYRIEVHRKRDVDPTIPLEAVSKFEKVRELAALTDGRSAAEPSGNGSAPTEHPQSTDRPAPAPSPRAQAEPATPAPPKPAQGQTEASQAPAPAAPNPARRAMQDSGLDVPAPSIRSGRSTGPRVEEAKPWEQYNSDGTLNLGSYSYQACVGIASLAYELLMTRNRARASGNGAVLVSPTNTEVGNLAGQLLTAADEAQAGVRVDGRSDRMDFSHSRARGAIRTALDAFPPPWDRPSEAWDSWHAKLVSEAVMVLVIGADLLEEEGVPRRVNGDGA